MILAAGRGTRLAPLTDTLPKALIEIDGVSLIERHLAGLVAAGFRNVVINLGHLGHLIEERLNGGGAYGLAIAYSREPDGPLETGGGIARALPLLGDEPFLVVNADIWTDYPFARIRAGSDPAHIVLVPNPAHHPAGDFTLVGDRAERHPQNSATFAGIGVYQPDLFRNRRQDSFPLAPILFELAAAGRLSAEFHPGCWFDIGSPARLDEARRAHIGPASGVTGG